MAFERLVDDTAAVDELDELPEVVDHAALRLCIARETELRVDVVSDPDRQLVDDLARLTLRLQRRRTAQELQQLVRHLVAVLEQNVPRDLDRQIALMDVDAFRLQKPRQVHRRRIRRVRLQQRRRQQQYSLLIQGQNTIGPCLRTGRLELGRCPDQVAHYIAAARALPNAEHFTSVAPSIWRAKS